MTIKLKEGLRPLRYHAEYDAICGGLDRARETCKVGDGFRVTVSTVQSNHLHLTVEADSRDDLLTGMRGLMACLGNALRALWSIRGGLFADRYHLEVITSPTRMRNAYSYVLNNARKHGCWTKDAPDPYSSGAWFDGWDEAVRREDRRDRESPVSRSRTWLGSVGWRLGGPPISFDETPSRKSRKRAGGKRGVLGGWNQGSRDHQRSLFSL